MGYSIKVTNEKNNATWEKQIATAEEFEKVRGYEGRDFVCLFCGTFKPVRTNTCKSFASDFFFPTLVNHAIKVKSIAGKIFAIIAAIILDIITLPIRLFTCIPRAISNKVKGPDAFRKYLVEQNVDKKLLEVDHVTVQLKGIKDGEPYERSEIINFIERPCEPDEEEVESICC